VYFAGMIFAKKGNWGLLTIGLFFLVSCKPGTADNNEKSNLPDSSQNAGSVAQADVGLLGSDSGIVVVEMQRKSTQLLGIWQQMPISGIKSAIATNATLIVNRIVKDHYKMEGGLTVLYKEFPDVGSVDVFVGIPVTTPSGKKMPALSDGFVLETLETGNYVKATVNAEPGATLPKWKAFKKWMVERGFDNSKGKSNANYPYFEYFQDSRNAEMTTTVSQAVLIMKKP
jgi:hypothetical protein